MPLMILPCVTAKWTVKTSDTNSMRPILAGIDEESLTTQQLQHQQNLLQQMGPSSNAAGLAAWLYLNKKEGA
jgi:hypothetical protein